MLTKEFRSGGWIFKQGATHGVHIYKLLQGEATVYEGDQKIATINVQKGQRPRMIGVLSALSGEYDHVNKRHVHTASVAANTDLTCETLDISFLRRSLRKELDEDKRDEIETVVKVIVMRDKIKEWQRKISQIPLPKKFEVPENVSPEVAEVLHELQELYDSTS